MFAVITVFSLLFIATNYAALTRCGITFVKLIYLYAPTRYGIAMRITMKLSVIVSNSNANNYLFLHITFVRVMSRNLFIVHILVMHLRFYADANAVMI